MRTEDFSDLIINGHEQCEKSVAERRSPNRPGEARSGISRVGASGGGDGAMFESGSHVDHDVCRRTRFRLSPASSSVELVSRSSESYKDDRGLRGPNRPGEARSVVIRVGSTGGGVGEKLGSGCQVDHVASAGFGRAGLGETTAGVARLRSESSTGDERGLRGPKSDGKDSGIGGGGGDGDGAKVGFGCHDDQDWNGAF
ncbi:hypothetical protein BD410DRAFT_789699 [Rickenella mellea]|uniref:Uncharacterized protein n=1 Tax=Rickenella mellea TaxID=50990 RepID=A0A4Y7Q2Y3_9AGAM|nr:hypothetical protein BD410DRAFT_789699 [Rickenella mellea]